MACDDSRLDIDCEYGHRVYRALHEFFVVQKQTENDIFPVDRGCFIADRILCAFLKSHDMVNKLFWSLPQCGYLQTEELSIAFSQQKLCVLCVSVSLC